MLVVFVVDVEDEDEGREMRRRHKRPSSMAWAPI